MFKHSCLMNSLRFFFSIWKSFIVEFHCFNMKIVIYLHHLCFKESVVYFHQIA